MSVDRAFFYNGRHQSRPLSKTGQPQESNAVPHSYGAFCPAAKQKRFQTRPVQGRGRFGGVKLGNKRQPEG